MQYISSGFPKKVAISSVSRYEPCAVKTLQDEIEARIRECLPDADGSTSTGWIQIEACRNTILAGNLLVVRRKPGGFPETKSVPVKRR